MNKFLPDVAYITTGKLDSNAAVENGQYPFFTCAPTPSCIDSYAFEEDAVLLAGNNAQGNFHISRYNGKFNAYQRTYVITAKEGYNIDYIGYSIELALAHLKKISQGSQTKFLTKQILDSFPIEDISLNEQNKIAHILKSLDDKIIVNNETISTLESLSKTLYDYYFLQFDFPDEKGRPYKSSGGKMEYNAELGREIPAGWKVTCLKKYIDIGNGKDHSHLPNGDYPVYGSGGLMRRVNQFLYDKESVLIPRKGTLNNVMLVNGPFWTVDTMYYTILKNPNSINYVYQTVKLFNLEKLNTGSALPSMTANIIYNLKVPDAPLELINEYERATKKLLSKLRTTENENRHLTALRDFLLPLLMNGQVGFKK